jgi:glycosyltransferase involved in cell wall biosynthesis
MPSTRPIRILRIIARLNIGGPAIQAISLSNDLSQDLYQTLLVCGEVGANEGDMSYLAKEKGVQPHIIPELGREISFHNDIKAFLALRKIIKDFGPDIIHTHTAKAGTLGRLAGISFNIFRAPWNRIRLVHIFHGHIFHGYFGFLKTFIFINIERFLASLTDRIIVISPLQQYDICQKYRIAKPEKVRKIPLGFDLSKFVTRETHNSSIRRRYLPHDSHNTLLVGIIGRLTSVKNHRMLLDAVKCLKNDGKDQFFKFLIVGDGELKQDLMHYSRELAVEDSIVFTGWQKEMTSIYEAMDMVLLTSLNEGTPVTLIESMAAGKPVVATDVGGVRDLFGLVDEKASNGFKLAQNGILVPSRNGEILARALIFMMKNRETSKKMAKNAREFVLNRYSIERLVKDTESLYSELIS